MNLQTYIARKVFFNCLHFYNQSRFSKEENENTFGACYSPFGHGHSYQLEAYFSGSINPETGMILNLTEIDSLLKQAIQPLENRHLNLEVEAFKDKIPTTENIALYLFEKLSSALQGSPYRLAKLRLYENEDLWTDLIYED